MYYLAIFDSGNYAIFLSDKLHKLGVTSEIVPIPCKLAKNGCGYCLKFFSENAGIVKIVVNEAKKNNIKTSDIYEIHTCGKNTKYQKIKDIG